MGGELGKLAGNGGAREGGGNIDTFAADEEQERSATMEDGQPQPEADKWLPSRGSREFGPARRRDGGIIHVTR